MLGTFRLGNLARFIPYPVVGGFLAGTGWLLIKGGLRVAVGHPPRGPERPQPVRRLASSCALGPRARVRRDPARRDPRGEAAARDPGRARDRASSLFAIGMLVTGSSHQLGAGRAVAARTVPVDAAVAAVDLRAVTGADWSAVLASDPRHRHRGVRRRDRVPVQRGWVELLLHTDLDSNEELRDAGWVNVVSSLFGGIPGYHALSLTSLAQQMAVDGRSRRPGRRARPARGRRVRRPSVVGLIPRMVVGGVLVFVGLSFIVCGWSTCAGRCRSASTLIVLAILATIATKGLLAGLVVGLVLAIVAVRDQLRPGRARARGRRSGPRTAATSTVRPASVPPSRRSPTASRSSA